MKRTLIKIIIHTIGAVGFLLTSDVFATLPCEQRLREDKNITQSEMNVCAHEIYKTDDAALNQVYQDLIKKLDQTQQKMGKDKLRISQRAWVEMREAHCGIYKHLYSGASMLPLVHDTCLSEATRHRIEELKVLLSHFDL